MAATVVAASIRAYGQALEEIGITDPAIDRILAAAAAAIENRLDLPHQDLMALLERLAFVAPPDIGFRSGSHRKLAEYGIVGHAIGSSRTLGQALSIAAAFNAEADQLRQLRYQTRNGEWRIDFRPARGLSPAARKLVLEEWLATFFAQLTEVVGIRQPDTKIELSYAPNPNIMYRDWLPVTPIFNCRHNRLTMPIELLSTPLRSYDDEVLHLILSHTAPSMSANATFAHQMRKYLTLNRGKSVSLKEVAAALGVSDRTLVRKLANERTTFSATLGEHRREYALILAHDGRLGPKQIAEALGFESVKSLERSFVRWTGLSLFQWRKVRDSNDGK